MFCNFDFDMCFGAQLPDLEVQQTGPCMKLSETFESLGPLYTMTWTCVLSITGFPFVDHLLPTKEPSLDFHVQVCFPPQEPEYFRHLDVQNTYKTKVLCQFLFEMCLVIQQVALLPQYTPIIYLLCATTRCTFSK